MSNQWHDIVSRHILPYISFHGLRHSYASFMLANGYTSKSFKSSLDIPIYMRHLTRIHMSQWSRKNYLQFFLIHSTKKAPNKFSPARHLKNYVMGNLKILVTHKTLTCLVLNRCFKCHNHHVFERCLTFF